MEDGKSLGQRGDEQRLRIYDLLEGVMATEQRESVPTTHDQVLLCSQVGSRVRVLGLVNALLTPEAQHYHRKEVAGYISMPGYTCGFSV